MDPNHPSWKYFLKVIMPNMESIQNNLSYILHWAESLQFSSNSTVCWLDFLKIVYSGNGGERVVKNSDSKLFYFLIYLLWHHMDLVFFMYGSWYKTTRVLHSELLNKLHWTNLMKRWCRGQYAWDSILEWVIKLYSSIK